jgi:hypothetical protein
MANVNDDVLIIGGVVGSIAFLSLLQGPKTPPIQPKKEFIHGADGIGFQFVNQHLDGFISSFHLSNVRKSDLIGSIAFGDGIYEEDAQNISAEIIMMFPPYNHTIDVTEGAGVGEYTKKKLKPNFDYLHTGPGFYAVSSGLPVYKFHIPIRSGRTFTIC